MGYDMLWSALPCAVFLVANDNAILSANPAAEAALNLAQSQITKRPMDQLAIFNIDVIAMLERTRKTGGSNLAEGVVLTLSNAVTLTCTVEVAPFENDQLLVLLHTRDGRSTWGQTADTAKTAASSAIGMSQMLAHEIKNPLAGISGAAQLLAMELDQNGQDLTDLIVLETRRITALLEQVEQFGNLLPPQSDAVNIHDVLERAKTSATVGFGSHMTFVEDYDPSLPSAQGDLDQLVQVVLNLIKNAAEAQKTKGTITLRTFYDGGLRRVDPAGNDQRLPLHLEVIDDGPGIPPQIKDQIFAPFVSGHENGTGLGLALVSKIVADHGAWMTLTSVPGRTVFRISLPMAATK